LLPLLPLLSCLLGVWIWSRYHAFQYDPERGLNVIEGIGALDLAQTARSVAEGEGFVTRFIRPVSLRYREEAIGHPELTHPPLYILVLALAMKFLEASDGTLVAVSAFFFFLPLPLLWWFSRRGFPPEVAALALFFYAIDPFLLQHSIDGGPGTFSAFLGLLFFALLSRSGASTPAAVGAGAAAGLAVLTRYSYVLWLIPGTFFLWAEAGKERSSRIIAFLGGALLVLLPWLVRNGLVAGNPVFSLQGYGLMIDTDPRPGSIVWRSFSGASLAVPRAAFFVFKKFLLGLQDQYLAVLLITGNFTGVFALASLLHRFSDRTFDRLKVCFFGMIVLEALSASLFSLPGNGMVALVPFALLLAAAFLVHLLRRWEGKRKALVRGGLLAFALVLSIIPITDQLGPRRFPRFSLYDLANIRSVARSVPPDSLLVSDVPWAVAWYGKVPCLWLPYRIEDYEDIRIYRHPPVSGFYLTRFYFGRYYSAPERSPDWKKVYQTGWIPGGWGFDRKTVLDGGQIFIGK
ncbi:MAG: glycosyltransferase family 39 protein, partial [Candidatus Aureabacteria bacterium]|nr:glycosyltransferase family 39 protein [Candidatus Auribacterota bacterium]